MTELAIEIRKRWKELLERLHSPAIMFGLFATIPYLSLVASGELVLKDNMYSDYASYQVPAREFAKRELEAGRFPLWIPELGCGIPLHATGQVGLAYPLLTPLLFVFDANRAIKLALFLHVIICYVGQYRLGRVLGLSESASGVSGLIACHGGFLTAHLAVGHVTLILAYSLFPWLFLVICNICQRPRLVAMCHFAIVVAGLLLVGHPQLPYYGLLFGGIWALASLVIGNASAHRLRCICVFCAGLLLGILIAAIQLIPLLELVQDNAGMTSRGDADYAGTYSLDGLDLYRLVAPTIHGNPLAGVPEFKPPDFFHEKVCYLGTLSWLLAFTSLYSPFKSRWPWGAASLIFLGLVIALGNSTVLFKLLGSIVPGLFLFRCPGRCLSVVSILLALLAGRGFDAAFSPGKPLSRITDRALTALLFLTACGATIVIDRSASEANLTGWLEFARKHLRPDMNWTALSFIVAITVIFYLPRASVRIGSLIVAVILVADLGYFNLRYIRFERHDPQAPPPEVLAALKHYRFIEARRSTGFSSDEIRYTGMVGQAIRWHISMVGTNEGGILPAGCETIFQAIEENADTALRLCGCRYIAQRSGDPRWQSAANPLPRTRFMPRVEIADLEEPLRMAKFPQATINELKEDDEPVEVVLDGPQILKVRVHARDEGVLIVADTFYPGWRCNVDGRKVAVQRVFGSLRGVRLPSGDHVVEIRYQPRSFLIGCIVSFCGIVLTGTSWLVSRRHRSIG